MKKLPLLLFSLFALFLVSCSDDDEDFKVDNQRAIESYLKENNIEAESSISGLYWVIENEGNGEYPENAYSFVTVNYKGYQPNGEVFDEGVIKNEPLKRMYLGWQEGIPKFSKGGSGKLFVPAHLAKGSEYPSENNFIIFEVELIDFSN